MTLVALEGEPGADAQDMGAKRKQIMDGARRAFLADGFDGASMNDIARAAGVSKGTLYVYFSSKEHLFEALIREDRRQQAERFCGFDDVSAGPRAVLTEFGLRLLEMMSRPESLAHLRTVVASAGKFPQLGQAFYEAGPQYGAERLAAYLKSEADKGILNVPDPQRAGWQFLELCKSGIYLKLLFSVKQAPDPGEMEAGVNAAVDMFLAAYGTPHAR